jgi:hypothetical protein
VPIEALPVHGDPVIDNTELPIQMRLLRKRIFDKMRRGERRVGGGEAQKRLEKAYRTEFWRTKEGQAVEAQFPRLPGQTRIMIPEIQTIAMNEQEFRVLIELAKSANTRNLIGTVLQRGCDVLQSLNSIQLNSRDEALRKRIRQALRRAGEAQMGAR